MSVPYWLSVKLGPVGSNSCYISINNLPLSSQIQCWHPFLSSLIEGPNKSLIKYWISQMARDYWLDGDLMSPFNAPFIVESIHYIFYTWAFLTKPFLFLVYSSFLKLIRQFYNVGPKPLKGEDTVLNRESRSRNCMH